jgi:hypothetical protein
VRLERLGLGIDGLTAVNSWLCFPGDCSSPFSFFYDINFAVGDEKKMLKIKKFRLVNEYKLVLAWIKQSSASVTLRCCNVGGRSPDNIQGLT